MEMVLVPYGRVHTKLYQHREKAFDTPLFAFESSTKLSVAWYHRNDILQDKKKQTASFIDIAR